MLNAEGLVQLNPKEGPDFVVVYNDDMLVFSKTLDDHLKHLELILDHLTEVGLKLKSMKCQFIHHEIAFPFLGHIYLNTTRVEDQQLAHDCSGRFPDTTEHT